MTGVVFQSIFVAARHNVMDDERKSTMRKDESSNHCVTMIEPEEEKEQNEEHVYSSCIFRDSNSSRSIRVWYYGPPEGMPREQYDQPWSFGFGNPISYKRGTRIEAVDKDLQAIAKLEEFQIKIKRAR